MIQRATAEDAPAGKIRPERPGGHRLPALRLALAAGVALAALTALPGQGGAQDAAVFTPTYAASQRSPYSDVYARTFGTTGHPDAAARQVEPPPLETAAPPPAPAQEADPGAVYVIEGGRLLTYRAADYAGGGMALDQAPLPPAETAYIGGAPEVQVPTIAHRLYGGPAPVRPVFKAAPLDTAAKPIPLTPPVD